MFYKTFYGLVSILQQLSLHPIRGTPFQIVVVFGSSVFSSGVSMCKLWIFGGGLLGFPGLGFFPGSAFRGGYRNTDQLNHKIHLELCAETFRPRG